MKKYQLAENGHCRCVENNIFSCMNPLEDKAGNHYWGESFNATPVLSSNIMSNGVSLAFDDNWKDEIPNVSKAFAMRKSFKDR